MHFNQMCGRIAELASCYVLYYRYRPTHGPNSVFLAEMHQTQSIRLGIDGLFTKIQL